MKYFKKFIIPFILILFSSLITDFILTKILYIYKIEKNENKNKIRIKHPVFHHHLRENYIANEDNGKYGKSKIITNSLGFRDKEIRDISLNTNKKRLVFIGDSFTEGILLNYNETFVGIFDNYYKNNNDIEILNAGVTSYSPIIYYNKIKYFLDKELKFTKLVVFIDISDIEDEALRYSFDYQLKSVVSKNKEYDVKDDKKNNFTKIVSILKENLFITYSVLNFVYDQSIPRLLNLETNKNEITEKEFIDYIVSNKYRRDKWTLNNQIYKDYEVGVKSAINYMNLLNELCKKNNIKLSIAVYPWFTQIYYKDLNSLQVKLWEEFSRKNEIQFINLFPLFVDEKDNIEEIKKKINRYFIPFDIHYNYQGNKIIAEHLFKVLKF